MCHRGVDVNAGTRELRDHMQKAVFSSRLSGGQTKVIRLSPTHTPLVSNSVPRFIGIIIHTDHYALLSAIPSQVSEATPISQPPNPPNPSCSLSSIQCSHLLSLYMTSTSSSLHTSVKLLSSSHGILLFL